jgi:parvulin-like peptidyl-prolyl isomerase
LGSAALARVGDETVSSAFVLEVARRHRLDARAARDRAVADALFALEARERLKGSGLVATVERSVWAEALLDELRLEAEARGPATAAELGALRRERWQRLDRPVSVATVHAVALVKSADQDAAAAQVAAEIQEATRGLSDPKEFADAANRVPSDGIEKRVESLPHVTRDGRAVQFDPGVPVASGGFDPAYAAAAHAIAEEGGHSPVVKTPFGYHVILLVERVDAQRYSDEQLRKQFADEVVQRRVRDGLERLTSTLKKQATVEQSRNVEQLTARLWEQR